MIEQIKKLKTAWDIAEKEKIDASSNREIIGQQLNESTHNASVTESLIIKLAINGDFTENEPITLGKFLWDEKTTIKKLEQEYKKANKRYNETWAKMVKIEKKIKKLQRQFWIEQELSILPEWEQKCKY